MYNFVEHSQQICADIVAANGKASPTELKNIEILLHFFANEDNVPFKTLATEMDLGDEIMGGFSPCQRAMWAFACHALASRYVQRLRA